MRNILMQFEKPLFFDGGNIDPCANGWFWCCTESSSWGVLACCTG